MNRTFLRLAAACALLAPASAALAGVLSGNCRVADQPAATLLYPYFEADFEHADGATTLISINNASSRPTVARVVLWTDWGAPTLAFDVYLTGYDVQSLNLRDLLLGRLPGTGPVVSPQGSLSEDNEVFAGCEGNAKAVTTMGSTSWDYLQTAHTGRPLPGSSTAQCLGSGEKGPNVATGYV